mmetsp:Transcript_81577/g.210055  ORF Transcript_81577/g.210055 Transcript_81577/m.210055 type:complete len:254 (+) Transcript_81577:320-1081(+)
MIVTIITVSPTLALAGGIAHLAPAWLVVALAQPAHIVAASRAACAFTLRLALRPGAWLLKAPVVEAQVVSCGRRCRMRRGGRRLRRTDGDVRAIAPHLVTLLAVPTPSKHVLPWRVGHLNAVHDAPEVGLLHEAARAEVVEGCRELRSCGAVLGALALLVGRGSSRWEAFEVVGMMDLLVAAPDADVAVAHRDRVLAPLRPCGIRALGHSDGRHGELPGPVIVADGGVHCSELERVTLEACLRHLLALGAEAV